MHATNQTRRPASLAAIRAEIDRLDDAILGLIDQRLAASDAVAALKESEHGSRLKLRPRREAAVIDRLVARADLAPPELIGQIWRALMAHGLQSQAPMEIVVCAEGDRIAMLERVRARFGLAAPVRWVADADEALNAARENEAIAVIETDQLPQVTEGDSLILFDSFNGPQGEILGVSIGRVDPDEAVLVGGAGR